VTPADLADVGGYILGSWAVGYCGGYMVKIVRRIMEVIGLGSG